MAVVGTLLFLAIDRDFSTVHIEHDTPRRIESFGPADQLSIERGPARRSCRLVSALRFRTIANGRSTLPHAPRSNANR